MVYALLPLVPIVLLLIFNKTVSGSIVLSVACAMVIGWCTALLVDAVCRRDLKTVFHDASSFFNGMGTMLTKVVSLIFVAALFAAGLQNAGVVSALISASKSFGLGLEGTGIVVSGAISIITLLTGSGVAAFTSLVPIAPDLAHALGGNTAALAVMMQVGAETVRAMSPVAGVVIIVAGFAKVSPLEVSRRCIVPSVVGYVVGISCAAILL
ncbi:MAG: C4-dicarboxylate transporter DcuC [Sutterella wadsworthensis]|nr:C4-dicarboxylate transporter DcuC [Sutterella wadsworthensis]